MPAYSKFIEDLSSKKLESALHERVYLSKEASVICDPSLLTLKKADPVSFCVDITLGNGKVTSGMLDFGEGMIKDVLIQVGKIVVPVDFVILDLVMVINNGAEHTILLGRPFMATTQYLIDIGKKNLTLSVVGESVTFSMSNLPSVPSTSTNIGFKNRHLRTPQEAAFLNVRRKPYSQSSYPPILVLSADSTSSHHSQQPPTVNFQSPPPAASSNLHLILPESPPYLPDSLKQLIKILLLIFRIEQQGELAALSSSLSSCDKKNDGSEARRTRKETKSASGVAESKGFLLERFGPGVDNPIGCYHAEIQELIFIDDLLSSLVGIEGRYISIGRFHGKDDSANFQVDASMDLALQPMMGSMKALSILIKKASAANFIGSVVLTLLQSQAKAMAGDHVVRVLAFELYMYNFVEQTLGNMYVWNEFEKSIKLGIIEDATNRNRLAKLLRFETSKSDGKLTSLDQYISRMKSGQKDIFYITVTNKEQLEKSPFPERLTKKNYEDLKFQNVSKEGLKIRKDSKDKELKEAFKELTEWWKGALASENIDDVKISNRLADTPCVVAYMRGKKVLEINPRHPIIKDLRERVVQDPEKVEMKPIRLLQSNEPHWMKPAVDGMRGRGVEGLGCRDMNGSALVNMFMDVDSFELLFLILLLQDMDAGRWLRTITAFLEEVIQLRKACSHPYLFPSIEPEPYQEGEHLVQASGKL
ncbi:endoplasmin homolog [Phtheirospermum japonicum]|uniref:Endoplasmin homolog n=1 Tax=Phtheirospermum japonicum TaxID=374723 RepID=A0A830CHY0_9LAMI|nr:endoplasmin homolog [Phtheirospermum japonicum]